MITLKFFTVDVFTSRPFKGNPLAICHVPADVSISDHALQLIAREYNISETVFVWQGPREEWTMRIFTIDKELPFAGHPTIGLAFHILTINHLERATLLCKAGTVSIELKGDQAYATIPTNFHLHAQEPSVDSIEAAQPGLRDHSKSILHTEIVSAVKGMNFVATELASVEALSAMKTTGSMPAVVLDEEWNVGFTGTAYYVAMGEEDGVSRYRTRMIETVMEDPATGSMSCALACLLCTRSHKTSMRFDFIQGVEMGRESHIGIDLEMSKGKVKSLQLYGAAVQIMEGNIRVPE